MKHCSYCGRENLDEATHCQECGSELDTAEKIEPEAAGAPVTVHRAFNSAEAQLVRSRLEAAGFHAFVQHELASLGMEGYSMAAQGILVQVPESEAVDAKELLADFTSE